MKSNVWLSAFLSWAIMDYLPVPNADNIPGPFEVKTRQGVFLGWHEQSGGIWAGDYEVSDFEALRTDLDVLPTKAIPKRVAEQCK